MIAVSNNLNFKIKWWCLSLKRLVANNENNRNDFDYSNGFNLMNREDVQHARRRLKEGKKIDGVEWRQQHAKESIK